MVNPNPMSAVQVRTQAMSVRSRASRVRIHAKWFEALGCASNRGVVVSDMHLAR